MKTKILLCPICKTNEIHTYFYRGVLALNDKPVVIVKCICHECKSHNIKYMSFPDYYHLITG